MGHPERHPAKIAEYDGCYCGEGCERHVSLLAVLVLRRLEQLAHQVLYAHRGPAQLGCQAQPFGILAGQVQGGNPAVHIQLLGQPGGLSVLEA